MANSVLEFGSRASYFSAAHRIVHALAYLSDDATIGQ
jgi:hypothetical protein